MIYSLLNWTRHKNKGITRKVERLTDALSCLESMLYLVCLLSHVCMFVCLFVCLNVCMFVCLFVCSPTFLGPALGNKPIKMGHFGMSGPKIRSRLF